MSESEIQIACAELCGWRWWKCNQFAAFQLRAPQMTADKMKGSGWHTWDLCERPNPIPNNVGYGVPNFIKDLNECRVIFKTLHGEERQIEITMTNESWHVRISDNEGDSFITVVGELGELPLVICQAFLQYKGEWKPTPPPAKR